MAELDLKSDKILVGSQEIRDYLKGMSEKTFRPWVVDQHERFPPSPMDFVPPDHLVHFIRDLVREELDLGVIFAAYRVRCGHPPYHPGLMTALLLYAYSRGIDSSRRIERACEERVDFMALTGMAKPDHMVALAPHLQGFLTSVI